MSFGGLIAGALGGAANAYSGIAQGQIDLNLKKQMMEAEEAMRARTQEASDMRQQNFTAGQNQLTRDQQSRQNSQEMALKAGELGIRQQDSARQGDVAAVQIEQLHAGIKEINQKLAAGDLSAKQTKELRDLQEKTIAALEDPTTKPDDIKRLTIELSVKNGTYKDRDKVEFKPLKSKDEVGNETETAGYWDPNNKTYTRLDTGGTPKPSDNKTFTMDQLNQDLINHPTQENVKAYDEKTGKPGSGTALLDSHYANPNGSQTKAPATMPATPTAPAAGLINSAMQPADDLAGYTTQAPASPIGDLFSKIGQKVQQTGDVSKANRVRQTVDQVRGIVESKQLYKLANLGVDLQSALNSGMLSPQETAKINAWLDLQK